jgi:hypothetical protein
MKRQFKILGFLTLISFCILISACKGKKDVEQLRYNVIANEALFESLVDYFTSVLPDSSFIVTFGVESKNYINLSYYKNQGNLADPNNHFGGVHLKLHSLELDKLLKDLGWTYETINNLTKGLKAINFDYICNTDFFCKPINIYDAPSGFVNSDYNIYPVEKLEIVKREIKGHPVGQTDFLKRVYIITTSAL